MGRRRYHYKKRVVIKRYRINEYIKTLKVRLIDETGKFIGVVDTRDALLQAQTKGLDLIEVSPKENPPVVRIADFGKFKYQQEKKKQKSQTKKIDIKGIRLTINMAAHDLNTKEKQTRKFLDQGFQTQLEILLKGREMIHAARAFDRLGDFISKIQDIATVIQPAKKKGRRITSLLQPKK